MVLTVAMTATATAQAVPERVDGAWVLPETDGLVLAQETAGMGPDQPVAVSGGYEAAIYDACARHGCNGDHLVQVMYCESGGDPGAWHANPYGGADIGLMQINDATWGSIAYAGPYDQIEWAAEMFSAGLGYHWSCF